MRDFRKLTLGDSVRMTNFALSCEASISEPTTVARLGVGGGLLNRYTG
jgi:hypothetical protein